MIIENCTFVDNSATESGAAVSLSSLLFGSSDNGSRSTPDVVVADW